MHSMSDLSEKHKVEALLFIHGEPLPIEKIGKVLKMDKEQVRIVLDELREEYKDRGIVLIEHNGRVAFGTHPDSAEVLSTFISKSLEEPLTPATLETLSIIAYLGPISKIHIDEMRGVNSYFALKTLSIRGLVEKNEEVEGRVSLYEISFDALRFLGISRKEDLPSFVEFKERLTQIKNIAPH